METKNSKATWEASSIGLEKPAGTTLVKSIGCAAYLVLNSKNNYS